jgi:hypothetical protein
MTRYGKLIGTPEKGGALFSCTTCGEDSVAAIFLASPVMPGGVIVDGFLGETYSWSVHDSAAHDKLCAIVGQGDADPAELRKFHWLFAPFYCVTCEANYCTQHWSPEKVHHSGGYNHTVGTCPSGHRQKVHGWSRDSAELDD